MAVPPPLPAPDKAASRRDLRAARARFVERLGPDGVATASSLIVARLAPMLAGAGAIGGYAAHRGEPDMLGFLREAYARGRAVALPRTEADGMRFVPWRPDMPLAPGFAGIGEPPPGPEIVPDTLLVPLIGFDRAGGRLGQGAGCYDRWLAAHRHVRAIGIGWSVQETAGVVCDPWDMPLAAIATEKEWIEP